MMQSTKRGGSPMLRLSHVRYCPLLYYAVIVIYILIRFYGLHNELNKNKICTRYLRLSVFMSSKFLSLK
jgi:hypothetical protein